MSLMGLVSRVTPIHTALRNCTGRGALRGRQSGVDLKPPQAAVVKSDGGERCGKSRNEISAGTIERGERKRTAAEVSKCD
jgi:hypothetical protein